jgi:hypothetical protein
MWYRMRLDRGVSDLQRHSLRQQFAVNQSKPDTSTRHPRFVRRVGPLTFGSNVPVPMAPSLACVAGRTCRDEVADVVVRLVVILVVNVQVDAPGDHRLTVGTRVRPWADLVVEPDSVEVATLAGQVGKRMARCPKQHVAARVSPEFIRLGHNSISSGPRALQSRPVLAAVTTLDLSYRLSASVCATDRPEALVEQRFIRADVTLQSPPFVVSVAPAPAHGLLLACRH